MTWPHRSEPLGSAEPGPLVRGIASAGSTAGGAVVAARPGKPVVVADVWDNPGGGVAVATIRDPIAVGFSRAAGDGAGIVLRFGGKAGPDGGAPSDG